MNETRLTPEKARQIAIAIQRLAAIADTKIKTREGEAEFKGINEFLRAAAFEHINELITTWHACVTEYEPFVVSLTRVLHRVASVDAQIAAQAQRAAIASSPAKDPEAAGNIITPPDFKRSN